MAYQIDLSTIPAGCLFNSFSYLKPDKVGLISQTARTNSNDLAELCTSNSLWRNLYHNHFPQFKFLLGNQTVNYTNWISSYHKRYAICSNIKQNKPKVKSFVNKNIQKIRTLANAFAFNTPEDITFVIYDYLENECKYEDRPKINIPNDDFDFLSNDKLIAVGQDLIVYNLSRECVSVKTSYQNAANDSNSFLRSIDEYCFAITSNGQTFLYDTRQDIFSTKCIFENEDKVITTSNNGLEFYVASPLSITAYDTRNPRGQILWKTAIREENTGYCDFNITLKRSLLGTSIIDLSTGQLISQYPVRRDILTPICGAIANNQMAVFGLPSQNLVFFDYADSQVKATYHFQNEDINSLCPSHLNGIIAVAADYDIKILKLPKGPNWEVEEARKLQTGSIALRKNGQIGPIKQIVFDGERLLVNTTGFVRVYDFYTPKKTA